jgi:uncharacterized surface protein with fasciclin (FAS1) repeats
MNNRFIEMARKTCLGTCMAVVCGGFTACTDDYDLDDEGNYPSWLGGSIYEALKNPESLEGSGNKTLTGTFSNYVRLIDDLGYAETLNKTGSKTVFPANDEAFQRFYNNNSWGVSSYEQLTIAMKKQLLYASMLDNALLVEMLSNVSDNSQTPAVSVIQGQALKHTTGINVIDSITWLPSWRSMPENNPNWSYYHNRGIYTVMDATRPMMVHFTQEQMTSNSITTQSKDGVPSDFEVITGTPYDENERSAYVFRNKIINPDVTCKNGYIHQMQDVLVPPGNLAEVIRTNGESSLYSRMLDRFSAPYYNATVTENYNDYAEAHGLARIDSIFEKRYFSERSHEGELKRTPSGTEAEAKLPFDPGWNDYDDGTTKSSIANIAAMFVPTDEALWNFFKKGGQGEFLITQFGKLPNERENLEANIDSIPMANVGQLISNLMHPSFLNSVPSKFDYVMDEASDPMGLTLDVINKTADGKYDVKIANNGVAYMLNKMFAPPSLISVSAPVSLSSDMRVMNEAVYDGKQHTALGLNQNYYAYLLAMSANYAFFIPTDDAFMNYYIDPCYLNEAEPRVLQFRYTGNSPFVECEAFDYDKTTGTVGASQGKVAKAEFTSLLVDILNYHTVVLADGDSLGANKYYKTKHGGAIRVSFAPGDSLVGSGAQVANHQPADLAVISPSKVTRTYRQANGRSYAIDRVITPPLESVRSVLQNNTDFSEFNNLCSNSDMDQIMAFANDKFMQKNEATGKLNLQAYHPFVLGGLDYNVNYFKSFNYTVYAPDNTAMNEAYSRGLPKWEDIKVLYDQYNDSLEAVKAGEHVSDAMKDQIQTARDKALAMVEEINTFVRYHFQDNSIYADNTVATGDYPTACSDSLGISVTINVSGGNGSINITDRLGQNIHIGEADAASKIVNKMTRDYVFGSKGKGIQTSSFAAVHQISKPLCPHSTQRYDTMWNGAGARKRLAAFRKDFETRLYKRYQ